MDKNQTLARPPERSTVEPGKAAPVGQRPMAQQPGKAVPVGQRPMAQQPGKAETHVPPPQQPGKVGAREKNT